LATLTAALASISALAPAGALASALAGALAPALASARLLALAAGSLPPACSRSPALGSRTVSSGH